MSNFFEQATHSLDDRGGKGDNGDSQCGDGDRRQKGRGGSGSGGDRKGKGATKQKSGGRAIPREIAVLTKSYMNYK